MRLTPRELPAVMMPTPDEITPNGIPITLRGIPSPLCPLDDCRPCPYRQRCARGMGKPRH